MIWRNPFISKSSEQQMSVEQFLALFDGNVLQMIEPQNLEKVNYIISSPGAGKTSLFRAFSARVLNKVVAPESSVQYKEIREELERLGIVKGEQVFLNSAIISCARGYSILDEMFQNGRRKQIFFALLNYRISIALIKSIGILLEIEPEQYDRIHFAHVPTEMYSDENIMQNGKTLYEWACNGERDLCRYLDSERNDLIEISFVHTTLLVLKLFEPSNILIDGKTIFLNTLVIFDDFHKLTENQKSMISEAIYTLKTNVGIWFGQRLEGLSDERLISMDGSINRDYNPNIVIDDYWPSKQQQFYKMLGRIADKRIGEAQLPGYNIFTDCISERYDINQYKGKLITFYQKQKQMIMETPETSIKYSNVIKYLDNNNDLDLFQKAIWIQCIIIQENRNNNGQIEMYLGENQSLEEFIEFVKKNQAIAKYYICHKNQMPIYFGYENLKILSSNNVEQFLYFASAYFDCCRIKNIEHKGKKQLSSAEQEKALRKAVNQKWKDMEYRYTNIEEIRDFLNAIARICTKSRDAERAAYAGGAYTGIAVDKRYLNDEIKSKRYDTLRKKLGACLASKYLERREIGNGEITIFYLNRWLCVYYDLPLAYGGWKKISLEKLSQIEAVTSNAIDSYSFLIGMEN